MHEAGHELRGGLGLPHEGGFTCPHGHDFLSAKQRSNERRTWLVIGLTTVTMVVEIVCGLLFGSMALLADGWHMASHASAMGITAFAYYWARKQKDNPRYAFGTGKIGDLAGFGSGLLLLLIALFMAYESIRRMLHPVPILFDQALAVAAIGLAVNLVSAFILRGDHDHHEEHDHDHDHNLRAAYLHVLADALTSILAIAALLFGKLWGWGFLDPLMGVAGALVISRWSTGLMRDTGRILLDYNQNESVGRQIRDALDNEGVACIEDLHVWRLGPGHFGSIISVRAENRCTPEELKHRLRHIRHLSHVTVEVNGVPSGRAQGGSH